MKATTYHDIDAVSQSKLKAFDRDPWKFYQQQIAQAWPADPPTASMIWGTQFEQYVWGDSIVEIPREVLNSQGHRKGKAWLEFAQANADKSLLTAGELDSFKIARQNLEDHPDARAICFDCDGVTWKTLEWVDEETGLPCKAELDRVSCTASGIVVIGDLKTASAVDAGSFARQAYALGYHRQAAWYRWGFCDRGGELLPFVFVVVHNTPSYSVECYELDDDFLRLGEQQNRQSLLRYREAYETGNWRSPSWGKILTIEAPRYAAFDDDYSLKA